MKDVYNEYDCLYYPACDRTESSFCQRADCSNFKDNSNYVEVVRCKDCAYCEKQLAHLYCGTLNAVVTEDWYCAFGKEET